MKRMIVTAASEWKHSGAGYFNPEYPRQEIVYDDETNRFYIYDHGTDIGESFYSLDEAAQYVEYNYPNDHVGNELYKKLTEFRGIKSSMTPQEVNDAIEQNKPFNIRDYTEYFDPPHDSEALLPSEIEIGREYINTEDASEFNIGTQFKVLDIVPESEREDWEMQFDYVFKVQTADGNVFNIHYDSEDYVGVLVR